MSHAAPMPGQQSLAVRLVLGRGSHRKVACTAAGDRVGSPSPFHQTSAVNETHPRMISACGQNGRPNRPADVQARRVRHGHYRGKPLFLTVMRRRRCFKEAPNHGQRPQTQSATVWLANSPAALNVSRARAAPQSVVTATAPETIFIFMRFHVSNLRDVVSVNKAAVA